MTATSATQHSAVGHTLFDFVDEDGVMNVIDRSLQGLGRMSVRGVLTHKCWSTAAHSCLKRVFGGREARLADLLVLQGIQRRVQRLVHCLNEEFQRLECMVNRVRAFFRTDE